MHMNPFLSRKRDEEKEVRIGDDCKHHEEHHGIGCHLVTKHIPTIRTGTLLLSPAVKTAFVKGVTAFEFRKVFVHVFITDRTLFHCYDQSIIIPDFLFI